VDYDLLLENVTLMDAFKLACAEAVAASAGPGILASDVQVTVYDGSVIVEAVVTVPDNVSGVTVADNFGAFDSLADAVVQEVQAVPGIAIVQTGEIGVIQVATATSTLASIALQVQVDDASSASTVLVLGIILGILCVGACGCIIVRIARRGPGDEPKPVAPGEFFQVAPVEVTPVEIFPVSPRDTIHSVKQKLDDGADDTDGADNSAAEEPGRDWHAPVSFRRGRTDDWVRNLHPQMSLELEELPQLPQPKVDGSRHDGLGPRRRSITPSDAWS